jgi:hypothetical protein
MAITLHIERLVLDEALLHGERTAALRTAFEQALSERLAAQADLEPLRRIGVVPALPPSTLPAAGQHRESLGVRLAAAVGEGIGLDRRSAPVQKG